MINNYILFAYYILELIIFTNKKKFILNLNKH